MASELTVPQIDFSSLGNLGQVYQQAQARRTLADLGTQLADGTIDYRQAAGKLAQTGNLNGVVSLLQLGEAERKRKAGEVAGSQFLASLGMQPQSAVSPAAPAPAIGGPVVPNDSNAIPGTVGMNLNLADRSQDFIQDNPGTSLSSGVRSTADQARLYADRGNNPNPVAPPGSSNHERGLAIDIGGMTPEQRAMLPQYGLAQPVANDPPHVELAGGPTRIASNDSAALPANAQATQGTVGQAQPSGGLSQRGVASLGAMINPNTPAGTKEVAKMFLQRELDASKPNEQIQMLTQMKALSGYPGSILDLKKELAGAGKTEVNIDTSGANSFAKAGGTAIAKRFEDISKEGDTATNDLALVGQLRDLGQIIKTGAPAAIQGTLANYGIKVGDNVGVAEAYGSIIDKLTPTQRVPGSGSTSDYEGRMFKRSLPQLINTPQGNKIIEDTLAGLAQSKIDRAKIAEAALAGEIKPAEALKQLRDLPNAYEHFKQFAKTGFKANPNAPQGAVPQESQPVPPVPGAKQAPDGKFYVPDPARPGKYLEVQP